MKYKKEFVFEYRGVYFYLQPFNRKDPKHGMHILATGKSRTYVKAVYRDYMSADIHVEEGTKAAMKNLGRTLKVRGAKVIGFPRIWSSKAIINLGDQITLLYLREGCDDYFTRAKRP